MKNTVRVIALAVIAFAMYSLFVFLIPFEQTEVFWLGYLFALVAFVVMGAAFYLAFTKSSNAKSKYYGFPVARVGLIYGVAQLIASLLVMFMSELLPLWIPLLVFGLGLGAALIGLISVGSVVDEIKTIEVKTKKDVSFMRAMQTTMIRVAAQTNNASVKALAEEIRYSDPVSNDAIADVEADLAMAIEDLQKALAGGNQEMITKLSQKAMVILNERNRLCKLNKN